MSPDGKGPLHGLAAFCGQLGCASGERAQFQPVEGQAALCDAGPVTLTAVVIAIEGPKQIV